MNPFSSSPDAFPRRDFLKFGGAGLMAISVAPITAEATPEQVMSEVKKIIGTKEPQSGRVKVVLPEIAENGGTVPLSVSVESPMTEADHVKAIHIFADGNPLPDVAQYFFGPQNGKAEVTLRTRLAKSQAIVALAEMSTGDVYMAQSKVKVTIGGCGG